MCFSSAMQKRFFLTRRFEVEQFWKTEILDYEYATRCYIPIVAPAFARETDL